MVVQQRFSVTAHALALSDDADMIEKITSTIERYSDKLVETERVLRAEMEGRLAQEVAKRERIMEEGYRNEKSHLETQLRDLKVDCHSLRVR